MRSYLFVLLELRIHFCFPLVLRFYLLILDTFTWRNYPSNPLDLFGFTDYIYRIIILLVSEHLLATFGQGSVSPRLIPRNDINVGHRPRYAHAILSLVVPYLRKVFCSDGSCPCYCELSLLLWDVLILTIGLCLVLRLSTYSSPPYGRFRSRHERSVSEGDIYKRHTDKLSADN